MINTFELPNDIDIEEYEGFVYKVKEISSGREYCGQKHFWSYPKGSKSKKKRKESNWKSYRTSSKHLAEAIKNDRNNYTFSIIYLCKDNTLMNYLEAKMILLGDYLCTDDYNGNVRLNIMTKIKDFNKRYTECLYLS